jgi:hypothetical protein
MKNYLPEALAIDQSKPSDFWRKRIKAKRRNLLFWFFSKRVASAIGGSASGGKK